MDISYIQRSDSPLRFSKFYYIFLEICVLDACLQFICIFFFLLDAMVIHKLMIVEGTILLLLFYSIPLISSVSFFDTFSNLTHTCKTRPSIVCVDVTIVNKSCVDLKCLIYSGGNQSSCISATTTRNVTNENNHTQSPNSTESNTIITTCNATWIYPTNRSLCLNDTSWNKTVCELSNVTCKVNSTQCSLNAVFYIGGFFNLKHLDGWGNLPASQLAITEINNDNKYLTNITLSLMATQTTEVR